MRFRVSSVPPNYPKEMFTNRVKTVEQIVTQELFDSGVMKWDNWNGYGTNHQYHPEYNWYTRDVVISFIEIEIKDLEELCAFMKMSPTNRLSICPTFLQNEDDPFYTLDLGFVGSVTE